MITPDLTKITNDYDNFKKQCNNITQSKPYTVTSILIWIILISMTYYLFFKNIIISKLTTDFNILHGTYGHMIQALTS